MTKQITLEVDAAALPECGQLLLGFHTLSQYRQPHAFSQQDDGLGDLHAVAIQQHALHEAAVDFQLGQRQACQVAQR